jgi:hypothetical protein
MSGKRRIPGALAILTLVLAPFFSVVAPLSASAAGCEGGSLIKGTQSSVYYCGADGKRYVFTNDKTYFTWFEDFSQVKSITDAELAGILIGGNVTYRPGTRMIKIQSDPRTYAVSRGGMLRLVASEDVAKCLFGDDWNKVIDDISDAFFVNYSVGSPIASCTDFDPAGERAGAATIDADKKLQGTSVSVPLTLSAKTPEADAGHVAFDAPITATFNEGLLPSSVTASTFILKRGSLSVDGTVSATDTRAIFSPSVTLEPSTTYTATLTTGVKSLGGDALADAVSWSFTAAAPTTFPYITTTSPLDGTKGAPLNAKITALFSETMAATSFKTETISLKRGATAVAGKVTYSEQVATFTPNSFLLPNTAYTATVGLSAKDLQGNSMTAPRSWTFTTGDEATGSPSVHWTSPGNNRLDVAVGGSITVGFSEAMDPTTITSSTFTLAQGSTIVAGTVTYANAVATFKPNAALAPGANYTATITTDAKDRDAHPIGALYTWSFTTSP